MQLPTAVEEAVDATSLKTGAAHTSRATTPVHILLYNRGRSPGKREERETIGRRDFYLAREHRRSARGFVA
jgi:hypothetical protein